MDIVLIPAYEPDEILINLTRKLKRTGFDILIVNDGSDASYQKIFDVAGQYATVVEHTKNRGKGAALKTGLRYIRNHLPECEHVITCDADGQHRVEDVVRVSECLHAGSHFVLTIRQFKKDMPFKSKLGNTVSRYVYTFLTNRYLSDNQSGLRGFHCSQIDWMLEVSPNKYDYEMNVLYYASKMNLRIATLPIEAIYIDNNSATHFDPFLDTVRIYRSLFRAAAATLLSFLVAEILVFVLSFTIGYRDIYLTLPTIGAISFFVTILLNRYVILKKVKCYDYWHSLVYAIIFYFVYTIGCPLVMYTIPAMPLWASFNMVYILCIPLRYCLHRFIFIASKTRE